ncbi:hypothetical protein IJ380_00815 [Candidatus Saccharibacteria bacterium]|nr:hypothetical protein [Candidatus Saccharibacteria bacterium]
MANMLPVAVVSVLVLVILVALMIDLVVQGLLTWKLGEPVPPPELLSKRDREFFEMNRKVSRTTGLVMMGVGIVLAIAGIILIFTIL